MKTYRRVFLKTLFKIGLFSLLPIKLNAFSQQKDCLTTADIEGPFYIPNAPNISILTPPGVSSNLLFITGTVYANDCITPIPNAIVDVWHANQGEYQQETGLYLNSVYDDTFYRGKIYTDINGNYAYQTILPGKYLNGNYYRPSHIHYKISYLEQNEVTTQLYFNGDSSIEIDPWASSGSAENRIINLSNDKNNNLNGVFDVTLNVQPEMIEQTNLTQNKVIKSIFPNPVNSQSCIFLQNHDNISIEICDINGKTIGHINNVNSNKVRIYDILDVDTKKGIYLIRIIKNKKAIDAKRFTI